MGARVELVNEDPVRHTADIHVQAGPLVATHVGGAEVPSLIDEIPVLCVAAAFAEGTTTFSDAAELRVKETDRVATTVALLTGLGAQAEPLADGHRGHRACGRPPVGWYGRLVRRPPHRHGRRCRCSGGGRSSDGQRLGRHRHELPELRGGHAPVPQLKPVGKKVIAIDGPAGSGKSTVARAVAARLGMPYLDTGAMYRAVAFTAMRRGVDPEDAADVAKLTVDLVLKVSDRVLVDGVDATIEVRSPEVTRAVSVVAANPEVRRELVRRQREWAEAHGSGVVEGRDIGTVVFPEAPVKIYMTASDEERAQRRSQELLDMHYDDVAADIARRDHIDSTRPVAPLAIAPDAVVVDTTTSTVDEVVELVLRLAAQAGLV